MAKEHDLVVEEDKEETKETEDAKGDRLPEGDNKEEQTEEVKEEVDEDKVPTFEEVEEKEDLIEKYNPNEKALYFRWKSDKRKRQEAQKELDELKAGSELQTLKESVSAKKLNRINEALQDPDLTVEKLQAIIAGKSQQTEEEPRYTKAEIEAMQKEEQVKQAQEQQRSKARFDLTEQIGRSKYENFDKMVELVKEEIANDSTGVTQQILNKSLFDTNIDEDQLADVIVRFAQLSPKFKEVTSKATPEDQEKVGRAITNSKKQRSSASITSSGGRRAVNEDDLTPDDAVNMTDSQWMKLKKTTRDRLLGKPA